MAWSKLWNPVLDASPSRRTASRAGPAGADATRWNSPARSTGPCVSPASATAPPSDAGVVAPPDAILTACASAACACCPLLESPAPATESAAPAPARARIELFAAFETMFSSGCFTPPTVTLVARKLAPSGVALRVLIALSACAIEGLVFTMSCSAWTVACPICGALFAAAKIAGASTVRASEGSRACVAPSRAASFGSAATAASTMGFNSGGILATMGPMSAGVFAAAVAARSAGILAAARSAALGAAVCLMNCLTFFGEFAGMAIA